VIATTENNISNTKAKAKRSRLIKKMIKVFLGLGSITTGCVVGRIPIPKSSKGCARASTSRRITLGTR
jgi:murein endopeptidase